VSTGTELDDPTETAWKPPRWASPVSLVICVLGIATASYLTYAHYSDASVLACSDKGAINCAKVTTSAESHFLGMPVAVLGLAFFVGMTALCLPFAWRRQEPVVRYARLLATVVGVGMILWLIYAELAIIDAICLYCTVVHGLTLALFFVVVVATVLGTSSPSVLDDYDRDDADDFDDDSEEHPVG
jgi:uncharacterized membrane protein